VIPTGKEVVGSLTESTERWGLFELVLQGPADGNPYKDYEISATFSKGDRSLRVRGFYDGNGTYRVRFMPDEEGEWRYETFSNAAELNGVSGNFTCTPPRPGNHGPVRVRGSRHFAYEDGTPYLPFGTTCYAWIHMNRDLQEQTLNTLAQAPFNKLRMCVFPKNYSFNKEEPDLFPFVRKADGTFDLEVFDPHFFAKLEQRILDLQRLGIEADLILFHPYDKGKWGFDEMDAATDDYYLRYIIARLASYRNVWWSMANEYDFMKAKTMDDWDRVFRVVQEEDPYGHLRSIHNGTRMYDHRRVFLYDYGKPWVTHVSVQHWDVTLTSIWLEEYGKPVIVDECCYEGNLPQRWGNITAEEMTRRFWDTVTRGGYCTHGETYTHPNDEIWWAKGGRLYGQSPERIAFLRSILEAAPADYDLMPEIYDVPTIGVRGVYYLMYFGLLRPAYRDIELPEGRFRVEIIDTWNMTIEEMAGVHEGTIRIRLPGTTNIAVRITRIEDQ